MKARKTKMSGGVWLNGRVYWCQYRANGHTIRENTRCTDAESAKEFRAKQLVARGNGSLNVHAKDVTFEKLVELITADYTAKGNRSMPYISAALTAKFAGWRALDITTSVVRAYEAARLAVVARATVNYEGATLRRMF